MKHFVLILFVAINLPYFAQVQITRDPIACAYGLKNEQNKWIVPAEYQQLLFLEKGFYACQFNEKWGIIRANGKKMLEPKFNSISVFAPGKYLAVEQITTENYTLQKSGVIDSTGQWFIPHAFSSIGKMQNEHYLLTKANFSSKNGMTYQSTIADSKGSPLFPYVNGLIVNPFYLKEAYIVGNTMNATYTVSGQVRFIDALGKTISDSLYDMGMPCGENFVVTKQGKYGLVNSSGTEIIEPQYLFDVTSYSYSNSLSCLHGHHQFVFLKNGKRGILNGKWEEVLTETYDQIIPLNSFTSQSAKSLYMAYLASENEYYLLDKDGKMLAQADTFMQRLIPIPKINYYELQGYNAYFIFGKRKNGQWNYGVLDENGSVLLPAEYVTLIINDQSDLILLEETGNKKIPKAFTMSLNSERTKGKTTLTFIQQIDNVYIFEGDKKMFALRFSKECNCWEQTLYGSNLPYKYGDFTLMNGNSEGLIYNHKTAKVEKVKFVNWQQGTFPVLQDEFGANLMHPTKGRLFNESKEQINQQFASINRIWAQGQNGKWKIYDTFGNPRLNEDFDVISYFWDTSIVQTNFKKGILDAVCNWILTPSFSDIYPITKQHYVGVTFSGKVGIINLNQPAIIDSSFNSFRPIYQNPTLKKFYYCLEKNGQTFIFNNDGGQLQTTEKELVSQYWTAPEQRGANFYIDCSSEEVGYLQTHKDLVYNFFYPFYRQNVLLDQRSITNGNRGSGGVGSYSFKVLNASYNKLSLLASQSLRGYVETDDMKFRDIYRKSEDRDFEVVNYILSDGKWRDVVFNQLFNTRDNNFQNVIIEAIQNSPNIRFDCNNPVALLEGATHFTFHKSGITLYFFEGQAHAFQLILSKEQLAKIPSARWILAWL